MSGFPEYGKGRFPKKQPKGICRGCRSPITEKGRITWCSLECKKRFEPFYVKLAVFERDKGICQMCGTPAPEYRKLRRDWNHNESYEEWMDRVREMKKHCAEFDHILPHCEGGLFVLENIRLLGRSCHLKRTAEWRKARRKAT